MLLKDASGAFRFFDAAQYLRHNPDVAASIEEGKVASAQAHYLELGQYENRAGVPLL